MSTNRCEKYVAISWGSDVDGEIILTWGVTVTGDITTVGNTNIDDGAVVNGD